MGTVHSTQEDPTIKGERKQEKFGKMSEKFRISQKKQKTPRAYLLSVSQPSLCPTRHSFPEPSV